MKKGFLQKRGEYLKTYKGFSVKLPLVVVYARPNGLDKYRFGCTAPRTVGNAVLRNRVKRWGREIYRHYDVPEGIPLDLHVFVGSKRVKYKEVKFNEFRSQVHEGLERIFRRFSKSSR